MATVSTVAVAMTVAITAARPESPFPSRGFQRCVFHRFYALAAPATKSAKTLVQQHHGVRAFLAYHIITQQRLPPVVIPTVYQHHWRFLFVNPPSSPNSSVSGVNWVGQQIWHGLPSFRLPCAILRQQRRGDMCTASHPRTTKGNHARVA